MGQRGAVVTLLEAIAEKRASREQFRIVAEHRAEAQVELWRAQARVGHAKRRLAAAPSPSVAESLAVDLRAELEVFQRRVVIGQEWGVV
jgi:hypothetical protein